jgi:uncharacterized protein with PIN domain
MTEENKNEETVCIAENEVKELVKEWKKDPYLWDSEADIQGELYVRIKEKLKKFKKIKGRYEKWMNHDAHFNMIYCNPLTYIEGRQHYHPDIVIYEGDDFVDDDNKNDPMLWVCEIKYKREWGGDWEEKHRTYDKNKLQQLLRQYKNPKIHGTKYAYFLELVREEEKATAKYGQVLLKERRK